MLLCGMENVRNLIGDYISLVDEGKV